MNQRTTSGGIKQEKYYADDTLYSFWLQYRRAGAGDVVKKKVVREDTNQGGGKNQKSISLVGQDAAIADKPDRA